MAASADDSLQIIRLWKQSMELSSAQVATRDALLNQAVYIAQKQNQIELLIKLYHWKAKLYQNNFDYRNAIGLADSAVQIAELHKKLQTEASRDAISFLSIIYLEFKGDDSCLYWIYKNKSLSKEVNDWFNYSLNLTLEAISQRDRLDQQKILSLYDSAGFYAKKTSLVDDDIFAAYNNSYFLKMQGSKDWVASLEMLLSIKQYFNNKELMQPIYEPWKRIPFKFNNPKIVTYIQIASTYLLLLDFQNCYNYQRIIVDEQKSQNNDRSTFYTLCELGIPAIYLNNKQLVQTIFDSCVLLAKKIKLPNNINNASYYLMQGWLNEMDGKLDKAIQNYNKSCYLNGNLFKLGDFFLLRSYSKLNDFAKADSIIQNLNKEKESSFVYFPQALYSKELAFYYTKKNKPDSAMMYELSYYKLKDSLLQAAHYVQLKEIDAKYQTEEKDRRIAEADKIRMYQKMQLSEAKKMNHLMFASIIGLVIILGLVGYVWQQKRKQAHLLAQKNTKIELLIRELHHRVKNNLQIVSGILSLHANRIQNNSAKEALEEGKARVNAIALLHQRLYMDDDIANVNMQDYIQNLGISLANSFGYDATNVHSDVQLNNNMMSIDKAIPIGLIINELVTNAFKHAFKNTLHPLVGIELQSHEKNTIQLKVFDNGVGINQTESIEKSTSFGMRMVQTLVRQLDASFHFTIQNGTQFIIEMQNV